MYNKCKKLLEHLITMKSAIAVVKMIGCPFQIKNFEKNKCTFKTFEKNIFLV